MWVSGLREPRAPRVIWFLAVGSGLGWVDVHLLASAILQPHQVWTADLRFAAVASELGIAHRIGDS